MKQEIVFEEDECYLLQPVNENAYRMQLVMTKEVFKECYKRWILEDKEQKE